MRTCPLSVERGRGVDRIWPDRNSEQVAGPMAPEWPNIYLTHCVTKFWPLAHCSLHTYTHTHVYIEGRRERRASTRESVQPDMLYTSSSLSFFWLMFVQMPSEYLHWKSIGLEISLLKTEIICEMVSCNPVLYIPGIFFYLCSIQ